jgi:chromosome segregation ATPase
LLVSNLEAQQSNFTKVIQSYQQVTQSKTERISQLEEKISLLQGECHENILKLEIADSKFVQLESQLAKSNDKIRFVIYFQLEFIWNNSVVR